MQVEMGLGMPYMRTHIGSTPPPCILRLESVDMGLELEGFRGKV